MNVGWLLPTHTALVTGRPDPRPLLELAAEAEGSGLDAIWLADSPLAAGLHDPLLMLAAVASRTDRVELGTGVLLAALRQPVLLAQSLASLDSIGNGRLVAGLGGGFASPRTARQFGAAGANYVRRAAVLDETIEILRVLWGSPGEPVSYRGRHFRFVDVVLSPAPVQPGGPPIWLAGAGERAEARVGRMADGWLPYAPGPDSFTASARRVEQAAEQADRDRPRYGLYLTVSFDPDAARAQHKLVEMVERWYGAPYAFVSSIQAMYAGPLEGFADRLAPYLASGVERLVLRSVEADPTDALAAVLAAAHVLKFDGMGDMIAVHRARGHTGTQVAAELRRQGRALVLVWRDRSRVARWPTDVVTTPRISRDRPCCSASAHRHADPRHVAFPRASPPGRQYPRDATGAA